MNNRAGRRAPALLRPLRHRDFALLMGAFTTSATGGWSFNVALVVWLIDVTGSTGWVAAATVGRFLPALLFSAYGGVLAERFEQVRLMRNIEAASAAVMVASAVLMAVEANPALVVAVAATVSMMRTVYEPAAAATTPRLVTERELGAANTLRNTIDNVCVIAGPALGVAMLLLGPAPVAVLLSAATFAVSAVLVGSIRTRSAPVDVTEGGEAGPLRQMLVGIRAIGDASETAVLVAFSVVATLVYGIDTVLFVVLSEEVLGTGAEMYGYLLAGLGVGGILAAGLVPRLERSGRMAPVIVLGMAVYCLPTLVFLVSDSLTIAFIAQVIRGAGTIVVDVLAITTLQRTLRHDVLARVFGAFDTLAILAVVVGSALVPVALDAFGLQAVLWFAGLGIPVVCLLGWPALARLDRGARERRARLAHQLATLEACDLFDSVPEGALEQLAGHATYRDVRDGEVVITEGEPADAFYVIESGTFAVASRAGARDGQALRLPQMSAGDWFGEIGLLEAIPRTATVTAESDGRLLRVDGDAFLAALTQGAPSAALLDGAGLRLGRTHQGRPLSQSGLKATDD